MPKIEVEVDQILTSAVAIDGIEPGDRLMVMNGVIIGLVERRAVRPPAPSPSPVIATPPDEPDKDRSIDARIVALLRTQGALTAREIGRQLANNGGSYAKVRDTMVRLRNKGRIRPTSDRRFPEYTA
jgi:hypothetical protein